MGTEKHPGGPQMDDASSALRQRLDRIERELRWWRRVGSLAVGLMAILALVSAAPSKPPDQIRAKRFVVVDKKGRSLAELYGSESLSSAAHPVLAMYGAKGRTAVELGVFVGETPRLAFWDKHGVSRGTIFVGGENGGGLIVRDENGKERALLDTTGLEVRDEQGRKGAMGATALRLRDERNSDR